MIACTIFDANIIDICGASQIFRLEGILQANTDFDVFAELEIQLVGAPALVASDIIV